MLEILLEKVLDLEDDVATIDHLISRLGNEDVAAIGLSAVTMAGRAPCDEKLRHLATCVAQIIEERSPWVDDIEYSQMLLHLVDQLTTTQLAILHFLADPRGWERRTGESLDGIPLDDGRLPSDRILCRGFPAFEKRPVALRAVIGGLEARGLLSVTGLRDDGSGYTGIDQFREGSASELGLELIEFLDLGR